LELRSLPLVDDLGGHAASIAVRRALVDLLRELGKLFVAFRIHVLCGRLAGDEADHQGDRGEWESGSDDAELGHGIALQGALGRPEAPRSPIGDSATHMPSTNPMLKGPCDSRNMLAVLRI